MNDVQDSAHVDLSSAQRHFSTSIGRQDRMDSMPSASESSRVFASLPWWIEEKFHWSEGPAGRVRLSPLPEFLRAVEQDARKLVDYGHGLLRPQTGSTEAFEILALVVYNVAFILPLGALFIAIFYGVASPVVNRWFRRHGSSAKAFTGVTLLLIAAVVWVV